MNPGQVPGHVDAIAFEEYNRTHAELTNRELAERLVLSGGTVKVHLKHIYGKLAVNNRTQVIARARELNLLQAHNQIIYRDS